MRSVLPYHFVFVALALYCQCGKEQYNLFCAINLVKYHNFLLDYPRNIAIIKPGIINTDKARMDHLEKGFSSGGAIFELMRRLIHRANYLQAYAICGKFFQGDDSPLADFSATVPEVAQWRACLKKMADKIDTHNAMSEKCK